ncbi:MULTISPECIES: myo-inosose-2 dehydratase [Kosmotoga]|uniref:Myo-inosose-2 dehydratase n=1 Tax=Kosmotoga olearia (strain ATCC BAA-1733 / DSM 21960 / TBF 19.5.1) TaxID=521045 RepID=C5CH31_KOSOT|nr:MULTISPECIES: myo-inosose-2 dehydratase [Kosmotoga]ACR79696.1 Myo-inosose-2 dehydratase [Kosmotoga olearia TBF 19.5.1]OAA21935.1 inosose dehydratase [Kosmotoga sp. DU53]
MVVREDIGLGIAPIGWTNDDMPELGGDIPFEQCIDEMAEAKFEGCEVGNKFPRDPEVLRAALEPRGLQVASAWFSTFFTTKDPEETYTAFLKHRDFLHAMGAKVIVVSETGKSIQGEINTPLHSAKPIFSDMDWKKLVDGLHELGKLAAEKGMKIVFHHHMGTGVQTYEEIRKLMELTDPELVYLLVDTGHMVFAGGDPVELIKEFGPRIKHVHFKDLRKDVMERSFKDDLSFLNSVKLGVFTVPGDGTIDFVPIVKALDEIDYKGWIIVEAEQDPKLAPPLEYAIKARNYLSSVLGF